MINLTAHEERSPLPCLCKGCLARAPLEASAGGLSFRRVTARLVDLELHAWLPSSLDAKAPMLVKSMEQRLAHRFRRLAPAAGNAPLIERRKPSAVDARKPGLWARLKKLFS